MKIARRGDLAVTQITTRIEYQHEPTQTSTRYRLSLVTSITREGQVKAIREITSRSALVGATKPIRVERLPRHSMVILPAAGFQVTAALAAVAERRADPANGSIDAYDSPVELLRDLHPWTIGERDCLAEIRHAAYRYVNDGNDKRCATCGVVTYDRTTIAIADDGCPVVHCSRACPVGVDFTTNYPVGLEVMVTSGFAAHLTARIERVSDAYPPDRDGQSYYAGRSYSLRLPHWGYRSFPEQYVRPVDPDLTQRHAVRREARTS
jgi:ferredoxin